MAEVQEHAQVPILLVDDHPEMVLALEATLARPDYRLESARSGEEVLRKVLHQDFAVILLDVLMPFMDGFETAHLLKQREATRNTPILFLTGSGGDVGLIYRAYSEGAVDYLMKPVDPDVLRAKVAVFAELYRKSQQLRAQELRLREAERVRGEQALRASEAVYEATFREAPVGVAHADVQGRWLQVNPRFCRILGATRDELLAQGVAELSPPVEASRHLAALERLRVGTLESYQAETRHTRPDGSVTWGSLTMSPLRSPQGTTEAVITVIEDITDRKRAEVRQHFLTLASEVLLSSLDFRQTFQKVARAAVPMVADGFVLDLCNPAEGTSELLIATHADAGKADLLRTVRTLLPDGVDPVVQRVLATGQGELYSEGRTRWLAELPLEPSTRLLVESLDSRTVLAVPLTIRNRQLGVLTLHFTRDGGHHPEGALPFAEDLAQHMALAMDNARLYLEAREAVQIRDDFLSIASHELRTPLTPLQLQLQQLLHERGQQTLSRLTPEQVRLLLQRWERQIRRLTSLVDELLDVSRISTGQLLLRPQPGDLAAVVGEVLRRMSEAIRRSGSAVHFAPDGPLKGSWDVLRLEQVVGNLVGNALKYGKGRPITVEVGGGEDGVWLEVRDEGIGLDPEQVERLFGRFERGVSSRSYGGLGLGLYIARQIVDAHEGRITADGALGEGARFRVELPWTTPQDAATPGEEVVEPGAQAGEAPEEGEAAGEGLGARLVASW